MSDDYEYRAIELIQKSIDEQMPLGQGGMPNYYDNKISYISESIKLLEKQISKLKKDKKGWNLSNFNNYNNNNNNNNNNNMNINGGKRRRRLTHKKRK